MKDLGGSRRSTAALVCALPFLLAMPACNRHHSNRGKPIGGLAGFGGLAADPERQWFCAADETTGRLVVVDATDGSVRHDVPSAGGSVGGLLYEPIGDDLYVSVSGRNRLQVYNPETMARRSTIKLDASPFALAPAGDGNLLVVTSKGLIFLNPDTLERQTLLAEIAEDATLLSDRETRVAFAIETTPGSTIVHRFDLTALDTPPTDNTLAPLAGRLIGSALNFDGSRLYVGTDIAPGIRVLDGTTLAVVDTIDVGGGLTGMALNTTGLRLFYSTTGPLAESQVVDFDLPGPDVTLAAAPRERGLTLAQNNQDLASLDESGALSTTGIHPFSIRGPSAVRQGIDATLTLHGQPNYFWILMIAGSPAPYLLDRNPGPDPRLIEVSLSDGFGIALSGQFDANGVAEIHCPVPSGFDSAFDSVWQGAQTPSFTRPQYELSNAMVIRVLADPTPPSE